MPNFKLSIITINRNDAAGLCKTIESVLSQPGLSNKNFEYIIVDGASADGSVDVIKEFEARTDFPLKITSWTSEPDSGIYNAMNKGISKATGTLVGIMNSGDVFLPDVFGSIQKAAEKNLDSVLYGAVATYRNNLFECVYGETVERFPYAMIPHNAAFVPLAIYKKLGLYDESFKIAADYDFFARLLSEKINFVWLEKLICNYDMQGVSATQGKLKLEEYNRVAKKYGFELDKKNSLKQKAIRWAKKLAKAAACFLLGFMAAYLKQKIL